MLARRMAIRSPGCLPATAHPAKRESSAQCSQLEYPAAWVQALRSGRSEARWSHPRRARPVASTPVGNRPMGTVCAWTGGARARRIAAPMRVRGIVSLSCEHSLKCACRSAASGMPACVPGDGRDRHCPRCVLIHASRMAGRSCWRSGGRLPMLAGSAIQPQAAGRQLCEGFAKLEGIGLAAGALPPDGRAIGAIHPGVAMGDGPFADVRRGCRAQTVDVPLRQMPEKTAAEEPASRSRG